MTATTPAVNGAPGTDEQASAAAEWVRGFAAGWRDPAGPEQFAAHFEALVDPEFRLVQPMLSAVQGLAEWRDGFVRPTFAALPDLRAEVDRWASSGDTVYIEFTMTATVGRRTVRWPAVDRFTLRDGRPVERVSYFDPMPLVGAVARSPRSWPRFLRGQAMQFRYLLRRRSSR
jgi:limonene-1,2-epoxide hydrolase